VARTASRSTTDAIALITGCAGGWRHGAAPGAEGAAAPAAKAVAPPGAPAQTAEGVTFTYRGAANSVALAGEFNSWSTSADALTRQADGSWTIVKRLAPGRHPYKFVIDGGTWKEDPGAAEFTDDGYGGKNSVVVVAAGRTTPAAAGTVPATTPVTGTGRAPVQGADGVTFTYAGPASSVNLAGDFNAWSTTAAPMVRQVDGTWTITLKLAPGSHTYKFLIDGSAWKQDEANPVSTGDPYGGKNSVVTVK
jgi:1,4-alpha-glucan branching enzyme